MTALRREGMVVLLALSCAGFAGGCAQLPVPPIGPWRKTARNTPAVSRPLTLQPNQKADIQLAMARSAESAGEMDKAIQAYLEVIDQGGAQAEVYHRLALLHDKKGDPATAQTYYREALALAPEAAQVYCDYGYSCYLDGRLPEAEECLRRAIELQPDFARAHNNLGILLARSGRENEALYAFSYAGASECQARLNLACALLSDGRVAEANRELELVGRLDPAGAQTDVTRLRGLIQKTQLAAAQPAGRSPVTTLR
jgi:tetratricopeptide (TPR) repeat protein